MRSSIFFLTAAALVAVSPVFAQTAESPLATRMDAEEGEFLVDGGGLSLYLFKADVQGTPEGARSACEDDCLAVWPPVLVEATPVGSGPVAAELLGTITRSDGSVQATYNGWPLYYYAEDFAPGDINGHDIESFGEDWYLIGPNGERARD